MLIESSSKKNEAKYQAYLQITSGCYLSKYDVYAAFSNFGDICIYENVSSKLKRGKVLSTNLKAISSVKTFQDFLFIIGYGSIEMTEWSNTFNSDVVKSRSIAPSFLDESSNCFEYDGQYAYIGSNNGLIYIYDIETEKITNTLKCSNTVHNIRCKENTLIATDEDGFVSIWNLNDNKSIWKFKPIDEITTVSNKNGYITLMDERDNWLVVGGGPIPSLWNVNMRKLVNVYNQTNYKNITCLKMANSRILVGSEKTSLDHWNFSGQDFQTCELQTDNISSLVNIADTVYCAGNSNRIEIVKNYIHTSDIVFY